MGVHTSACRDRMRVALSRASRTRANRTIVLHGAHMKSLIMSAPDITEADVRLVALPFPRTMSGEQEERVLRALKQACGVWE